jgi:peptidyl-prolyl cis-trans isomerase C
MEQPNGTEMTTTTNIVGMTVFLIASATTGLTFSATEDGPAKSTIANLPAGAIAVVNGTAIPQSQLDAAIQESFLPETAQLRNALKQKLIAREVFRQNAEKAGYGDRPEVKEATENDKTNAEVLLYLKESARPNPVTDQEVKTRYEQGVSLAGAEEYRFSMIAVVDDATAKMILGKLKSGGSFESLAQQFSIGPEKEKGGEMPWMSIKTPVTEGNPAGWPLSVVQALVDMKVGTTSNSIDAGGMQIILKLNEKRPTVILPYEQCPPVIRQMLRQQLEDVEKQKAMDAFVSGQVEKASIQQ